MPPTGTTSRPGARSAGLESLPASRDTLALYLTVLAGVLKTATLQRRLSAIAQAHKLAGHESPTASPAVRLVWAGIRRTHGTAQEGKAPALAEDLRAMVTAMAPPRHARHELRSGRCSRCAIERCC